jgi:nucleoid-associated protein YejK
MAMVLTQTYLEPAQKRALSLVAKKSGRKVSDLVRDAVDAAVMGVTVADVSMLDAATLRAQDDLRAMVAELKGNSAEHKSFMSEIKRLRKAA